MNRKTSTFICLLGLISLPISLPALANESGHDHTGWYVGGSLGGISVDSDIDLSSDGVNYETETETDGSSLSIFGGHNFTPSYGIEAAIEFSSTLSEEDNESVQGEFDAAYTQISITPRFSLQFNDIFSIYAKVGPALLVYLQEHNNNIYTDEDETGWVGLGGTAGIGMQFSVSKKLRLRVSADRTIADLEAADEDSDDYYDPVTDQTIDPPDMEVDITRAAIGLYYQF